MKEKMRPIHFCISRSVLLVLPFQILASHLSAQTADQIAKELESIYGKGAGTAISFVLDGEKNSLLFANGSPKFRLESPDDLITSDGTSIWHYTKKKKEVVIDKASSKGSSLSNAEDILKFSSNYSGVLTHKHGIYELQLAPSKSIAKLMENAGGISQITFSFTRSAKSGIQIKRIMARASTRNISISNIAIKTMNKLDKGLFIFHPPAGVKTIDLRD